MDIIRLEEIDSTNTYVKENAASLCHGDLIYALTQTAGRGQRGNSWESHPRCNITCSMILRWHDFPANRQFAISQAISLAIIEMLREECNLHCRIKWPNDIYYGESKICGILIEHALTGMSLDRTIAGMGININQRNFLSDAPNPISVFQITGKEYDIDSLVAILHNNIMARIDALTDHNGMRVVAQEYRAALWRGDTDTDYPFHDVAADRDYRGVVEMIEPTGHLTIRETSPSFGLRHRYAFKEVEWTL